MPPIADLQDTRAFPGVEELCSVDWRTESRRKHWVLLAQIERIHVDAKILGLTVRDRAGREYRVFFPFESRFGDAFPSFINGRTVAVAYPEHQHVVHVAEGEADSKFEGVVIGEETSFVTFPVHLEELLRMNRELRDYLGDGTTPKKCHGCGKTAEGGKPLLDCGRCGYYSYCNAECQKIGWTEKDHKEACKILKDANIQSLLHLDYEGSEGEFELTA